MEVHAKTSWRDKSNTDGARHLEQISRLLNSYDTVLSVRIPQLLREQNLRSSYAPKMVIQPIA